MTTFFEGCRTAAVPTYADYDAGRGSLPRLGQVALAVVTSLGEERPPAQWRPLRVPPLPASRRQLDHRVVLLGEVLRPAAHFDVVALLVLADQVLGPGLFERDQLGGGRDSETLGSTLLRRQRDVSVDGGQIQVGEAVAEDEVGVADQEFGHHRLDGNNKNVTV